MATTLFGASEPTARSVIDQLGELLRTGGVGAQIPIIQRSVEATKQATSQALASTDDSLRAAGLAGTPWGQNIKAQAQQQGAFNVAQVPTNLALAMEKMALPVLSDTQRNAMAGAMGVSSDMAHLGAADVGALAQGKAQFWDEVFHSSTSAGHMSGGL